jgi:hypothetical protein
VLVTPAAQRLGEAILSMSQRPIGETLALARRRAAPEPAHHP